MPYIKEEDRESAALAPSGPGELNYALSTVLWEYFQDSDQNYAAVNEIIGALECCKIEFYRRIIAPYEDIKIRVNGDVYVQSDD